MRISALGLCFVCVGCVNDLELASRTASLTPTDVTIDRTELLENQPNGALVGLLSTDDGDVNDEIHVYSLVGGEGDTHNAMFTIVGAGLRVAAPIDFESTPTLSVRIASTDRIGNTFSKAIELTVIDKVEDHAYSHTWSLDSADDYVESDSEKTVVDEGIVKLERTWLESSIPGDDDRTWDVTLGDLDGDGDLDVYTSNVGVNEIWLNNGDATFVNARIPGDEGTSWNAAFGDVDGDGDLDIHVANFSNQQNKLWINDGTGAFTAADIPDDLGASSDSQFADFDGDGDLDLYVSNQGSNRLWINDGTGSFTANDIADDDGRSDDIAVGDIDGDGDLDICVPHLNEGPTLWLNDGDANFVASNFDGGGAPAWDCEMIDVDHDGDLDLYISTTTGAENDIWINDGTGAFTENSISGDVNVGWTGVVTDDFDRDGSHDIYLVQGGTTARQNVFWLNDRAGSFSEFRIPGDDADEWKVDSGDLDGDGNPDIYTAVWGAPDMAQNKLYLNRVHADRPFITPTEPFMFDGSLARFVEVTAPGSTGETLYQVSVDGGTTWLYWDGEWKTTTATDGTETNPATEVDANLADLTSDGGAFLWRVYLASDGVDQVALDEVRVELPAPLLEIAQDRSDLEAEGGNLPTVFVRGRLLLDAVVELRAADSGTASPDVDFSLESPLAIPAGEYDGTNPVSIGLTIVDDQLVEEDETIELELVVPDATGVPGDADGDDQTRTTTTYTIEDDDTCETSEHCPEGQICDATEEPSTCEPADACGNGTVEGAEACDDGNTAAGDGCSETCRLENGALCDEDSSCDSNVCDLTESTPVCEPADTCGNGRIEGDEVCDDGNTDNGDDCASDCLPGNLIVSGGGGCTTAVPGPSYLVFGWMFVAWCRRRRSNRRR